MITQKNTEGVHAFIVIVNYYRGMWDRRSHLLQPFNALTSNKLKLKWTDTEQKVFDDIKRAVAQDTLLAYTDFNKYFELHTHSRYYQLGAVVIQKGKPIDFYSRKLIGPQA